MGLTVQVTFDCADPAALAAFWVEALDYRIEPPPSGFDTWDDALDAGRRRFYQQGPAAKTPKNGVHRVVRAAGALPGAPRMAALEAKADVLVGLGAERVRRHEPDAEPGSAGFLVLRDPEGNEFCLD